MNVLGLEPMERTVGRTTIRLEQGDLTAMEVDAVVYYARENLELSSGFGTGIQSRGGAAVKAELDKIGRIGMGEAVITTAGRMNAGHVIHACGPKFQEQDTEGKLRQTMRSALKAANDNALRTLAFPPMGAGFYGVPLPLCAAVMIEEITGFLAGETTLEAVTICVMDKREFQAFESRLQQI